MTPIPETTYSPEGADPDESDADTEDIASDIEGEVAQSKMGRRQPGPAPTSLSDEDDTYDDFKIEVQKPRPSVSPSVSALLLLIVLSSLAAAVSAAWLLGLLPW